MKISKIRSKFKDQKLIPHQPELPIRHRNEGKENDAFFLSTTHLGIPSLFQRSLRNYRALSPCACPALSISFWNKVLFLSSYFSLSTSLSLSLSHLGNNCCFYHLFFSLTPSLSSSPLILSSSLTHPLSLGGNSQNFLCKFLIFFVTLGLKILRL